MPCALLVSLLLTGAPMTAREAEQYARAHWFEFEFLEVPTTWKGDWAAFVKAKQKEEQDFTAEARKAPPPRMEPKLDDEQARARRIVQVEFNEVALKREAEIRSLARAVLESLQRGDFEPLIADCAMYSATAPNKLELTRKFFAEHQEELRKAAAMAQLDAGDFITGLQFERPSPQTGIPGKVLVSFGPKQAAAKDPDRYPDSYQLELWWAGEVMPEANAKLNAAPPKPKPKSRWRFVQLLTPYSRTRTYLQ